MTLDDMIDAGTVAIDDAVAVMDRATFDALPGFGVAPVWQSTRHDVWRVQWRDGWLLRWFDPDDSTTINSRQIIITEQETET